MLTVHHTRTEIAGQPCTTAVLPVGALEQHGRHLPVGTDIIFAEAVAERVAKELNAYLLPSIAVSASIEHRKAKGTVYLRAETLAAVVRDVAESLQQSGFTRLIVANFHGGNWILKPTIRELNRALPAFRTVLLVPDLPPATHREIFEHAAGDIHAGEYETSLMLHLHPEHVRPLGPAPAEPPHFPPQPYLDYFDATELTPEGHWGWPHAATAEKGRRALEALVAASLRYIEELEAAAQRIAGQPREGER